ncbi:MAG: SidA/IucD/PvdA family monooxygenase, partial [Geminicoccaceae bacterium]
MHSGERHGRPFLVPARKDKLMITNDYDLIGAGFGPAGVALATALADWEEAHDRRPFERVRFFEKSRSSKWHPDLLVPNTDI